MTGIAMVSCQCVRIAKSLSCIAKNKSGANIAVCSAGELCFEIDGLLLEEHPACPLNIATLNADKIQSIGKALRAHLSDE